MTCYPDNWEFRSHAKCPERGGCRQCTCSRNSGGYWGTYSSCGACTVGSYCGRSYGGGNYPMTCYPTGSSFYNNWEFRSQGKCPASTGYHWNSAGVACPAGRDIESVSQCEAAGQAIAELKPKLQRNGQVNDRDKGGISMSSRPYGCYVTSSSSLNFNRHTAKKNKNISGDDRRSLCKAASASSTSKASPSSVTTKPIENKDNETSASLDFPMNTTSTTSRTPPRNTTATT